MTKDWYYCSKKHSIVAFKLVMIISWLFVMEVKLFRVQYTVCPGNRKFETNNILLAHKGREKGEPVARSLVYMHPSVSCE